VPDFHNVRYEGYDTGPQIKAVFLMSSTIPTSLGSAGFSCVNLSAVTVKEFTELQFQASRSLWFVAQ